MEWKNTSAMVESLDNAATLQVDDIGFSCHTACSGYSPVFSKLYIGHDGRSGINRYCLHQGCGGEVVESESRAYIVQKKERPCVVDDCRASGITTSETSRGLRQIQAHIGQSSWCLDTISPLPEDNVVLKTWINLVLSKWALSHTHLPYLDQRLRGLFPY